MLHLYLRRQYANIRSDYLSLRQANTLTTTQNTESTFPLLPKRIRNPGLVSIPLRGIHWSVFWRFGWAQCFGCNKIDCMKPTDCVGSLSGTLPPCFKKYNTNCTLCLWERAVIARRAFSYLSAMENQPGGNALGSISWSHPSYWPLCSSGLNGHSTYQLRTSELVDNWAEYMTGLS